MSSKRDKMRDRARARRRVRARRKAVSATKALGPRVLAALETEPLIAYGARCSWWDAKENAGTRESGYKGVPGLPCCPHCGGVLFEIEERTWNIGVETREAFKWAAERDDYPELVAWSRGRCYPEPDAMLAGWEEHLLLDGIRAAADALEVIYADDELEPVGRPACPVHGVPEPCPTCSAHIAGGL